MQGILPKPWANIAGALDIHENRDNVSTVNNVEHGRAYSFVATISPNANLWVDFGYTIWIFIPRRKSVFRTRAQLYSRRLVQFRAHRLRWERSRYYSSQDHYVYADAMWKPLKRVTAMLGYGGSIIRGNTTLLNPLTPTGTLDFDYIKPFASLALDIYRGLSYKTAWNYYNYNDRGVANPTGLAPLPLQDFNGNNVTFSFRYAF